MSKLKLLIAAIIGLVIINLSLVAFIYINSPTGPGRPGGGPPPGGNKEGVQNIIIEKLDLDQQQQKDYFLLIEHHQFRINELDDSLGLIKQNLFLSLNAPNPAEKSALIDKIKDLTIAIENTHYEHFTSLKKLCRPEQLPKFEDLTKEISGFFSGPGIKPPPR